MNRLEKLDAELQIQLGENYDEFLIRCARLRQKELAIGNRKLRRKLRAQARKS